MSPITFIGSALQHGSLTGQCVQKKCLQQAKPVSMFIWALDYNVVSGVPFLCVDVYILIFCGTFQPMAREYQNGDGFGYILAFRRKDTSSWTTARVPHVESSRYVYYNDSLTPYSPFEVKIKAYNRRGEGPFSQIAVVHSAEEGESL